MFGTAFQSSSFLPVLTRDPPGIPSPLQGERATWPNLASITCAVGIESALDACHRHVTNLQRWARDRVGNSAGTRSLVRAEPCKGHCRPEAGEHGRRLIGTSCSVPVSTHASAYVGAVGISPGAHRALRESRSCSNLDESSIAAALGASPWQSSSSTLGSGASLGGDALHPGIIMAGDDVPLDCPNLARRCSAKRLQASPAWQTVECASA